MMVSDLILVGLFVGVRGFRLPGGVDIDLLNLTLDVRVLAVAPGCAVAGTLLIALVAGAFGFSVDIAAALRSHSGATPWVTRRRTRALLLTGQVAVALESYGYTPVRATAFFEELSGRLSARRAIRRASMTDSVGGMTSLAGRLVIDGESRELPSSLAFMAVDQRYFDTIGVRVRQGRDFSPDDSEGAPLVGLASESFGRLIAHGESPTGHRITIRWIQ